MTELELYKELGILTKDKGRWKENIVTNEEYSDMFALCSKIRKLLIASIMTAKKNSGS